MFACLLKLPNTLYVNKSAKTKPHWRALSCAGEDVMQKYDSPSIKNEAALDWNKYCDIVNKQE